MSVENGCELRPLSTVQELLEWCPKASYEAHASRQPLQTTSAHTTSSPTPAHSFCASSQPRLKQRILLCHDFRGGYSSCEARSNGVYAVCTNDKSVPTHISNIRNAWKFRDWAYIDVFVYFSHTLVSPPPVGFIEAAHTHACKILGTIVFEWDPGKSQLMRLLDAGPHAAEKLVQIAAFFGFEGFLLNVECSLEKADVRRLLQWIKDFREVLCERIPSAEVIWYDAITIEGELKWQNDVTPQNELFFQAANFVFLNYGWNPARLRQSACRARRRDDPEQAARIFAGVDVHGRGTFSGGGYDSYLGVRAALAIGYSAALFASAWTAENGDARSCDGVSLPDAKDRELCFWSGREFGVRCVGSVVRERAVIAAAPVGINFDLGWSEKGTWKRGTLVDKRAYYNLRRQSVQGFARPVSASGLSERDGVRMSHTTDFAYDGGASIQVSVPRSSVSSTAYHTLLRLFCCDCFFSSRAITVSFVSLIPMQSTGNNSTEQSHGILLVLDGAPPECLLLMAVNQSDRTDFHEGQVLLPHLSAMSMKCSVLYASRESQIDDTGWIERRFLGLESLLQRRRLVELLFFQGAKSSLFATQTKQPSVPSNTSATRESTRFRCRVSPDPNAAVIDEGSVNLWRRTNSHGTSNVHPTIGGPTAPRSPPTDDVFLGMLSIHTGDDSSTMTPRFQTPEN